MPHELQEPRQKLEASSVFSEQKHSNSDVVTNASPVQVARMGKTSDVAPASAFLTDRDKYLLPIGSGADVAHPVTGHRDQVTIYEPEDGEKVLDFELFRNYLSMIVEKDGQR